MFLDRRPVPQVTLSLEAARWLMRKDPYTRSMLSVVTQRIADAWAGRMLGRALAHEIGHYLLRSPEHASSGLMRAAHTVDALIGENRRGFNLTPEQRRTVLAVHAMSMLSEMASAKE